MAESFSETYPGFNMTSGLPFAATNERRDLSTLSQMGLLIMEQQQNDVAVEPSTGSDQTNGFSGDCFLEECNLPWHCKAGGVTAGNGAQGSTQVTSRESNAVVSPEMHEQSGIASMPPSIPKTNLGGNETKATLFHKLKTFLSVTGLTLFKKEMPAAPAFGCESAHAASPSPRNLKHQENKHEIYSPATMKWSKLQESTQLLAKHKSCLFQRFSVCNSDECPFETRKVRRSSVSRALCGLKTILEFTVGRKPMSFDLANLNYCDYETDSEVPKVATLAWKHLGSRSRNCELAELSTDRACAYDVGIPQIKKRRVKQITNGSGNSELKTFVPVEYLVDFPKPGPEISSECKAKVSVTAASDCVDQAEPKITKTQSLAMIVYEPKVPSEAVPEGNLELDMAFAERRSFSMCSGNTLASAPSEERLILDSSQNILVLAPSEKRVLGIEPEGALNPGNCDKSVTPVSSDEHFDPWFTGEGLLPLFRKECLTPELSPSAETSIVIHDCPTALVPAVNSTVLYSANTGLPSVTNEEVNSALPTKQPPHLNLKSWLQKPKSQLWTFLDMKAFFVRVLDRKTFKLRCLDVKLNIVRKSDLEYDFSEFLANVRLELGSEEPEEYEKIENKGSAIIDTMSVPSFTRVSKQDVCLNSSAALKHPTCSPSLLRHLVRSKDALMVQCKKWFLAQYDFHDQVEDYLISLLERTQAMGDLFLKVCTDMAGNLRDDEHFDYDFFLDDYLDYSDHSDYPNYPDYTDYPDCDSNDAEYADLLDCYFEGLDPISSETSDTGPSDDLMEHYEERLCAIMEDLEALEERDQNIKETIDQMNEGYQSNIFNVLSGFKQACRHGKAYRDDFREICKEIESDLELTEAELNQVIGCASITDQAKFWDECMDLKAHEVLMTKVRRTKALYEIVSNSRTSLQSAYEEVTLPFLRLTYNSQGIKRDSVTY